MLNPKKQIDTVNIDINDIPTNAEDPRETFRERKAKILEENKKKNPHKPLKGLRKDPKEWKEIEELVLKYQLQFKDKNKKEESDAAMIELLDRFYPLFKKYLVLVKSGQINFHDSETRRFVYTFIGDAKLKAALKRHSNLANHRQPIHHRFNFVREVYGCLEETEIMDDFKMIFMEMAQRYKSMGRNFCAYVANAFYFEVSRYIKAFISNPANIWYRHFEFEDYFHTVDEDTPYYAEPFEDKIIEDGRETLDMDWIAGTHCQEVFKQFSPLERKIIALSYADGMTDKQISEYLSYPISQVQSKRRHVIQTLEKHFNKVAVCRAPSRYNKLVPIV